MGQKEMRAMIDGLEEDLLKANAIMEIVAFSLGSTCYNPGKDITGSASLCAEMAQELIKNCIYRAFDLKDEADGLIGGSDEADGKGDADL